MKDQYTEADFKEVEKNKLWGSLDGEYIIERDDQGYVYPHGWFYSHLPKNEIENFWCCMVNRGTEYEFSFPAALKRLNDLIVKP